MIDTPQNKSLIVCCLAVCAFVIVGCASEPIATANQAVPPPVVTPPPLPPVAVAPTPVPPPPLTPVAFDTAIENAANALFKNVTSDSRRMIVIDPLIDGNNGQQTYASGHIEKRLREIARQFPSIEVQEFSSTNVAQNPIVLVGTFTGITLENKAALGKPEAYRICLALADLATNKIVSKGVARSIVEGVNVTPLPYYADIPVWTKDPSVDAYIKTCQGTKVGDVIDVLYRDRIDTATTIADATSAYNQGDFSRALRLYMQAVAAPTGDQLRVHSGLYMTNWRLGRRAQAEQAFGRIVEHGLAAQKIAVKFLFRPGGTEFWPDQNVSGPYPFWLRQISTRLARSDSCIDVVGHTSRSGSEEVNDRVSLARAQAIKRRIDTASPKLVKRTSAKGMGFRENIVGTGADDLTDLPDRRVEFKLVGCANS